MEELAEKNNDPLKDSEIARLIDLSNSAGYKKQESIPARNLIDFKPKSLLDIALKDENKGKKNESQPESNSSQDQAVEETQILDTGISEDAKVSENKNIELKETEETKPEENKDTDEESAPKDLSQDAIKDQEEKNQVDEAAPETSMESLTEVNQALETNGIETPTNEVDPLTSARQEGIEIGKKMADTEARNNLALALKTINSIIESLKGKDILDKTNLMNSLLATITNIACERAGQIIDEHPESFKEKVLAFIDDIDKSAKKVILNLNPHDAKLVGSSILEHFSENEIEIKENSDLFRGDSILQLGSIEVGDIISDKITFSSEINVNNDLEPELTKDTTISPNKDDDSNEKKLSDNQDE